MRASVLIVVFFLLFWRMDAQNIQPARVVGQAYATYADHGYNALYTNQAGLYDIEHTIVHASAIQRYFSEGINQLHVGTAFRLGEHTGAGVYVKRFGDNIYSEQSYGFAIGRQLFERFSLGIGLEGYQLQIENYGSDFQLNAQIGFQANISPNVRIGTHFFFPMQAVDDVSYSNQSALNIDVAILVDDHLELKAGVQKVTDRQMGIKLAMNYQPIEKMEITVGVLTFPAQYSVGIGYEIFRGLQLYVLGFYQTDLGWSSGLNIGYTFGS